MLRPLIPVCASLLLLAAAGPSYAQGPGSEETRIRADQVSFERARNLYEAEGNVRVEQPGGRVLEADWMVVNTTTQIGVAVGNVSVREGEDEIRADFAAIDLSTLQAIALGAELDLAEGIAVQAAAVRRTGEQTYVVEGGSFSSCRCTVYGRRPWELDVGEADVEVGGYATARHVFFRVLDVPLLYVPWLILPVKDERQSGALPPHLASTSRGGTEIELPVFWAARDNVNILLRPTWVSKRGAKLGAETEYVFGEEGEGAGGFAVLGNDREVEDDPNLVFSEDRWVYWLRHEQPLAEGIRIGSDVARISDNYYALDFEDLAPETRSARALDSKAWASFARSSWYAGVEGIYSDDLQAPNDLDRDDFLLHRLPDVHVASLPRKLGPLPLMAGLDAHYTYFYQREDAALLRGNAPVAGQFFDTGRDGLFDADEPTAAGIFDGANNHLDNFAVDPGGSEGDGLFQEGELLADHGHRWDVAPRLVLPLQAGPIEMLSEVGYRGTFYSPSNGSAETRSLWTGRAEARSRLVKDLEIAGRPLRHVVEPRLAFGFISDQNQARNPLLVPDSAVRQRRLIDRDLRVLLRNPSDRVAEERLIQGSLGNRFFGAAGPDGLAPRLLGSARLSGGYDLERSRGTPIYLEGALYPSERLSLSSLWGYDPKASHPEEVDVAFSWRSEPRFSAPSSVSDRSHSLNLVYRYLFEPPVVFENYLREDEVFEEFEEPLERINQINAELNLAVTRKLDVFASGFASFESSGASGGQVGFAFLPACACWELITAVEQRLRPDDTRFTIEVRLAGFGFGTLTDRVRRIGGRTAGPGSVDDRERLWDSPAP